MIFLVLIIIPAIIAIVAFVTTKHEITWYEFAGQLLASALIAGGSCIIIYYANVADTEMLNGHVTSKASQRVSCSHDYCCQECKTCDSKGSNCSTYCCQTCFEHSYDVDWNVQTTVGGLTIDRIDRQGVKEPPRFTRVILGEPATLSHWYTNYIKAAPDSLFNEQGLVEEYEQNKHLPVHPEVYDYYRADRLVLVGASVDPNEWNYELSKLNDRVGTTKQANVIVVLTTENEKFYYVLRQKWVGGKKNDIIVIIGLDAAGSSIKWARVMSWAQDDIFNVKLRDDILALDTLNRENVLQTVEKDVVKWFQRKPMADFEYLESSITPTKTEFVIAFIINLIISIGITFYVMNNNINERTRW